MTSFPIKVRPLTKAERAWVNDLQAVLARCPKRLELVTTGDASLDIIDGVAGRGMDLYDGRASKNGLVVATVKGGPLVHGVSG